MKAAGMYFAFVLIIFEIMVVLEAIKEGVLR
jgi:hypothetical protein